MSGIPEKTDRNQRLYNFWKAHYPNWKYASIAKLFQISTSKAWLIIDRMKKREAVNVK